MSGSNRSLLAPAIFGLVVTCFGLGAFWNEYSTDGYQQQASEQTQRSVKADPRDTSKRDFFAAYPDLKSGACYQAQSHDTADLCAQWRAAFAAEKAARASEQAVVISEIGLFLSAFGLAALYWTIRQGQRGLKAARKANRIARETSRRELRAYMAVDEISVEISQSADKKRNERYLIKIIWKNCGQTPALRVKDSHLSFKSGEDGIAGFDYPDGEPAIDSNWHIGPGSRHTSWFAFTPDDFAWPRRGKIIVYGWIEYFDAVGTGMRHRSETCSLIAFKTDPSDARSLPEITRVGPFNGMDETCFRTAGEPAPRQPIINNLT